LGMALGSHTAAAVVSPLTRRHDCEINRVPVIRRGQRLAQRTRSSVVYISECYRGRVRWHRDYAKQQCVEDNKVFSPWSAAHLSFRDLPKSYKTSLAQSSKKPKR
jgi:hypothetical protein